LVVISAAVLMAGAAYDWIAYRLVSQPCPTYTMTDLLHMADPIPECK
jgi:hypothetical protein